MKTFKNCLGLHFSKHKFSLRSDCHMPIVYQSRIEKKKLCETFASIKYFVVGYFVSCIDERKSKCLWYIEFSNISLCSFIRCNKILQCVGRWSSIRPYIRCVIVYSMARWTIGGQHKRKQQDQREKPWKTRRNEEIVEIKRAGTREGSIREWNREQGRKRERGHRRYRGV